MSLNGLDSPAVQEASRFAIAESGGWFLLKYVNRDSVELYERGKAGVNEARVAVAKYEEASPLYGLIIYRRRKVLIKYVPEGTSRLLQARTAVHFQDVMERYSPYETLLEIKTAEGLSDTALANVFPLHTSSPAVSSNRLNEISEDAEDGAPALTGPTSQPPPSSRPTRDRRADRVMRSERQRTSRRPSNSPPPSIKVNGETSVPPSLASPKSTISQFLVREESGQRSISSLGTPSIGSVTEYAGSERSDTNTEPESAPPSKPDLVEPASPPPASPNMKPLPQDPPRTAEPTAQTRQSASPQKQSSHVPETRQPTGLQERHAQLSLETPTAQSLRERNDAVGRPSIEKPHDDDPYDLKKYDYLFKPKTKLGPRPVTQDNKKARPSMPSVAAVPSNIKPQPPKKDLPVRPKSQGPTTMPLPTLPAPPPIPDMPEYNPRPLSRGSVKSLPSHKSTSMTPDKLRLMKAIELRKKQMRKSQGAEMTPVPNLDTEDLPEVPKVPEQAVQKEQPPAPDQHVNASLEPEDAPSKKADSGIEMDYQDAEKREDKQTLELLESPRRDRKLEREHQKTPEKQRSPTPTREQGAEMTPKAEPVSPITVPAQDEAHSGAIESEISPVSSRADETANLSSQHAKVPTIVQPEDNQNTEPSLDESQIFGDDPNERYEEDRGKLGALPKSPRRQNSDLAKRRRGYVEPLHLEDMSTDDEFGEELSTADIQEAKPMTVAKSPIHQSFIRRPSEGPSIASEASDSRTERALARVPSNGMGQDETSRGQSSDPLDTAPGAERYDARSGLKRNVSSGISQRIQALADKSSREQSPNGYGPSSRPMSPETPPGNFLPRDRGVQSRGSLRPSRSRTSSFQKTARLSSRMSASQQNPGASMSQNENTPVLNVHRDPTTNRDSVSVTARIVRPHTKDEETPPAEELQRSSYMFNNDRPIPTETMAQLTRLDTTTPPAMPRAESARSISPEAKRMSSDQTTRAMHSSTRNHFGRHKQPQQQPQPGTPISPHPDDFPVPPVAAASRAQSSTSLASVNANNNNDDAGTSKDGASRTSRFFKRMSNIATKRRSTAQGSVASESTNSISEVAAVGGKKGGPGTRDGEKERSPDMPPPVVVGSLNVQFPDSLLWKRRILSIDATGYLCFAIPQAMEHQRSASKKFPLSDFRAPYTPDLDRQELPHSVMLDFVEGGTTLQVAAEDGGAQRQVVGLLRGYWGAWTQ